MAFRCALAQRIDADEKLLDSAKDDGRFGAPAVRIGMFVDLLAEQGFVLRADVRPLP